MNQTMHTRSAIAALLIAFSLTGLGFLRSAAGEALTEDPRRVVLIGVRSMSWQSVIDLMSRQRLPRIRRLARGALATADIISEGYTDPGEVLASIVTGKFPFKHRIHSFPQIAALRDNDPMRQPIWDMMRAAGEPVGVVGIPFWDSPSREDAWVSSAPEESSEDSHIDHAERRLTEETTLRGHRLPSQDVLPERIERIIAGQDVSKTLRLTLRDCLADDLSMVSLAERTSRITPRSHLFVYFDGLGRWEKSLEEETVQGLDHADARILLENYYEVVDAMIGRLISLDDRRTTFLLFSEKGNKNGPITYRPMFPQLNEWPPIGLFMAWGHGIKQSARAGIIKPVDIAVTILYLAGVSIPNNMDGNVLLGILDDDYYHKHPLEFTR